MLIGEGSRNRVEAYFALRPAPHLEDAEETIEHTRALLNDAVAFIAPLHPAAMLSGGLDSTALTAMLARQNGRILSFSVDYRDNTEDFRPSAFCPSMDAPFASMASQAFGTEHHVVVLDQAALASALSDAVSARGFPGMADVDSSMLLLFAAQIARRAPVVVSGECGDEVFGGYPWFREGAHLGEDAFPWSGSVALRESILSESLRSRLNLPEYVRRTLRSAVEQTGIDCAPDDREGELRRIQLLCFRFFMANLQERAVRMCEPAGLTVLTPLCDERLVQYVFNVPWKMKFMGGMEKGLFRAAVRDYDAARTERTPEKPLSKDVQSDLHGDHPRNDGGHAGRPRRADPRMDRRWPRARPRGIAIGSRGDAVVWPTDGWAADAGLSSAGKHVDARAQHHGVAVISGTAEGSGETRPGLGRRTLRR